MQCCDSSELINLYMNIIKHCWHARVTWDGRVSSAAGRLVAVFSLLSLRAAAAWSGLGCCNTEQEPEIELLLRNNDQAHRSPGPHIQV